MVKVLVSGGAGFIGSHLCDALIEKRKEVFCVDNLISGDKKNIGHLMENKKFHFLEEDVNSFSFDEKIDEVFHLASLASPVDYFSKPIETMLVGSIGTKNLLDLSLRNKAKFLFTSTSEIYGDPLEHPQKESYFGNVNPVGERSCFSEDTEVLTISGWKFFKDVNKQDFVLTLNKNGFIEYQNPTEIINQYYSGQLISFKSSKIDLLVTPNHKMYVKPRGKKFMLIEAFESINWKRAKMKKSAEWIGKEKAFFSLSKVKNAKQKQKTKIDMDVWLEFFGYFLTEGSTYLGSRLDRVKDKVYHSKQYYILISQSKKNKENRKKISNALNRLGFKFYEENAQFRISSKQLFNYLRKFGKSKDKFVDFELKQLSKRQLKILFDALMLGDGNKKKTAFYSSSVKLIGDFQEILLKLGLAGSILPKDKRQKNPVYQIHILNKKTKNFLNPIYPGREIENYKGFVWCVNVPNHIIYVRRNGKALFCGNCYDESKRFSEALIKAYEKEFNFKGKIVRIFNTFGPRMRVDDGRVVPNFINQALNDKPLTVYGSGKQTRSFCFVSDMVEGILKVMESDFFGPVNLGNPKEFSILDFAEKIKNLSKKELKIEFKPPLKDDPKQRKPDISLAKEKLNWSPKISLDKGLKITINYFKDNSN